MLGGIHDLLYRRVRSISFTAAWIDRLKHSVHASCDADFVPILCISAGIKEYEGIGPRTEGRTGVTEKLST